MRRFLVLESCNTMTTSYWRMRQMRTCSSKDEDQTSRSWQDTRHLSRPSDPRTCTWWPGAASSLKQWPWAPELLRFWLRRSRRRCVSSVSASTGLKCPRWKGCCPPDYRRRCLSLSKSHGRRCLCRRLGPKTIHDLGQFGQLPRGACVPHPLRDTSDHANCDTWPISRWRPQQMGMGSGVSILDPASTLWQEWGSQRRSKRCL